MKILNRYDKSVTFESDEETMKKTVEEAVGNGIKLNLTDLSYADLRDANLGNANFCTANLESTRLNHTILSKANFNVARVCFADLSYADLREASLFNVDLRNANLNYANLNYADLSYADLRNANLNYADLRDADLSYADLRDADLRDADLRGTVLDPGNKPNQKIEEFQQQDDEYIYGYRYNKSLYCGEEMYQIGHKYQAPYFSTCNTECHPGLFFMPTKMSLLAWQEHELPIIKVKVKKELVHKAGSKYRAKEFEVVEVVK